MVIITGYFPEVIDFKLIMKKIIKKWTKESPLDNELASVTHRIVENHLRKTKKITFEKNSHLGNEYIKVHCYVNVLEVERNKYSKMSEEHRLHKSKVWCLLQTFFFKWKYF